MDEQDVSTLGKRSRDHLEDNEKDPSEVSAQKTTIDEDESDDEVGPMPAPAEGSGATKKKRKGLCLDSVSHCSS
jgi:peptidylprolyl isomerase domain and WD repeat-containing protein 1